MFWTLELATHLEEAPWPASKDDLIDFAIRTGAPVEVVENLQELDISATDLSKDCLMDILPRIPAIKWISMGQLDGLNDNVFKVSFQIEINEIYGIDEVNEIDKIDDFDEIDVIYKIYGINEIDEIDVMDDIDEIDENGLV